MKLCIIIPAHNEEKRIAPTLNNYADFFGKLKSHETEILVVLNACSDNTEKIVKDISEEKGNIKYINFEQGGKGFAVIQGFKHALAEKFDLVGFVDADM